MYAHKCHYLFFSFFLLIQTVEVGAESGEEEGFDYNIIPVYSVITNCYCLTKKLYVASREHWPDYVARCLSSPGLVSSFSSRTVKSEALWIVTYYTLWKVEEGEMGAAMYT